MGRLSLLVALFVAAAACALAADKASGIVALKTYTSAIEYGWLVRGPLDVDPSKTVLRMYLSSTDIGAKIEACHTMTCADEALTDGVMVDFGDSRHLGYAIRLNGERVQYSGGTDPQAFALSTNKPDHLAGKLHIDDTAAGGGKIDAEFDLTVVRTFKTL